MIMGMMNWLKLLAVSKKSSHLFLISKVILSDPSHWVMLTKTSLVKGLVLHFGFVGGPILIEDLVESRILGTHEPSYIP